LVTHAPSKSGFESACVACGATLWFAIALVSSALPASAVTPDVPFRLQGKWPGVTRGLANNVTIAGNFAYVAFGPGGLAVLDVSNPATPVRVGSFKTSGLAQGVAVVGHYAYVAAFNGGFDVFDVSDPAHCVRVGGCYLGGFAMGVAVVGNSAFVASQTLGLQVIDVSDPTHGVLVGGYTSSGVPMA
jgi:hypothetical protein